MKREDKSVLIDSLTEQIKASTHFYLADVSEMNAQDTVHSEGNVSRKT
jgi:large subunit ribosomal protein L10